MRGVVPGRDQDPGHQRRSRRGRSAAAPRGHRRGRFEPSSARCHAEPGSEPRMWGGVARLARESRSRGSAKTGHSELDGIYSVRASDGGGLVRLLEGPVSPPRYSPDGTRLSFFDTKEGVSPTGSGALFVMRSRRHRSGSDHSLGLRLRRPRMVPRRTLDRVPEAVRPDVSRATRWLGSPPGSAQPPFGHGRARIHRGLPTGRGSCSAFSEPDHAEIYMARPDGTGLREVAAAPDVQAQHPDWGTP